MKLFQNKVSKLEKKCNDLEQACQTREKAPHNKSTQQVHLQITLCESFFTKKNYILHKMEQSDVLQNKLGYVAHLSFNFIFLIIIIDPLF